MSSQLDDQRPKPFDPIGDIRNFIDRHHNEGDLPIIVLTLVVLYNLIFFDFPLGFGIYSFLPILSLIIAYFSHYWSREEIDNILLVGIISTSFGLLIDLIVSVSYVRGGSDSYESESIPTLFLDLAGLISIYFWSKTRYSKSHESITGL